MRILSCIILVVILNFSSQAQTKTPGHAEMTWYRMDLDSIRITKEFQEYLVWSGDEFPFISDQILYASELLFSCPRCVEYESDKTGVYKKISGIFEQDKSEDFKSVVFFTEIKNECFAVILRTTYNNITDYNEGIFVGKEAYFQFLVSNQEVRLCSKMTLKNN